MTPPILSQHNRRVMKLNLLYHFVQGTGFLNVEFAFSSRVQWSQFCLDLLKLVLTRSKRKLVYTGIFVCLFVDIKIIIIIIIIIIILGISFMQGIYTYIPETNHVPREHCVAAIVM
jgi:hypothetical protein